jgi:CubicO group peptidase (beta-lactamase class C family)
MMKMISMATRAAFVAVLSLALSSSGGGDNAQRPGVSGSGVAATGQSAAHGDASVKAVLDRYVDAGRIAGVVSVLSDADYNETYDCSGWADIENRQPIRPDNVFAIFSMTKNFTGAAVMCAIDEKKISLDDEVAKYLPEFADVVMKDGSKPQRPLVVRHLLCHVSGFRGGCNVINRDIPLREVARKLAAQQLEFQPEETFGYNNAGICTAAACLEVAVGMPYEKYLEEKILKPLGMKDTTFWPNEEQLKRLIKAYNSDDTPLRPAKDACAKQLVFPKSHRVYPAASGGLFSTPVDMIRFSQMLAHHGEWKGKTIISRETFDSIFAVKQTPAGIKQPYTCGSWIYGDWFGHEGAMRTDQRANLKTGHSRVFFIQTENKAGQAFFELKKDWHEACDKVQGTPHTEFGN